MLEGFENVTKRDGSATLNWVNEETNSRLVTFAEDSGYDGNMVDRIISMAKTLAGKYADMNTKEPRLDNLPPFDPKNYILVQVQVVGQPEKIKAEWRGDFESIDFGHGLKTSVIAPVEEPAPVIVAHQSVLYTKATLNTMNKADLSVILGEEVGERTKAELIDAILEKQG